MAYTRTPNQKNKSAHNKARGQKPRAGDERKTSNRAKSSDRKSSDRDELDRGARSDNRGSPKRSGGKNTDNRSSSNRDTDRKSRSNGKPNDGKPSERKFGDRKRDARSTASRSPRSFDEKGDGSGGRYPHDAENRGSGARGSAQQRPSDGSQNSEKPSSDQRQPYKNRPDKPERDQRMFGAPKRSDQRMFGAPENGGTDKHGVASRKKAPAKPRSRRESFANFDTMPTKPRFDSKGSGALEREGGEQRIAKLLARAGVASRREIERMIADGRISLNGTVVETPATLLKTLQGVTVDGHEVGQTDPTRLFIYHKPSGFLTAERDFSGRKTIYDELPRDLPRLMPIGRLDLNTEGLLLMTNDGEFKRQMELPRYGVERTYRARTFGDISQDQLESLVDGIEIEGIKYGRIDANLERRTGANQWVEMTLTEGKNREVRRVLEHFGLQVSRLIRTRYGPFELNNLPTSKIVEVKRADVVKQRRNLKA